MNGKAIAPAMGKEVVMLNLTSVSQTGNALKPPTVQGAEVLGGMNGWFERAHMTRLKPSASHLK